MTHSHLRRIAPAPMTDEAREAEIARLSAEMEAAYAVWQSDSCFAAKDRADSLMRQRDDLVRGRSAATAGAVEGGGVMRKEVIGDATLYLGDCLEILPTLPKVDACITDPPYGINTKSDGSGKLSPWGDLCNSAYWYAAWIGEVRRKLQPTGALWTCLNWRSMVTFQKAACDLAWPIESMMVWDKQWIGPGGTRGLRPSYELVALFGMPDFGIEDRGLPDVQQFPVGSYKATGHPAEKPIALMDFLVKHSRGPVVVDCFMGSGTTGVSAVSAGRKFIGIEQDAKWFDSACRRIEQAYKQRPLFEVEPPKQPQQLEIGA